MEKKLYDDGYINFFKVDLCGLYLFSSKNDNASYGLEIDETFRSIMDWANKRPFSETIPWKPHSRSNVSNCYLKDIYHDEENGDYFLVLWKSDSAKEGVMGAEEDGVMGKGKVYKHSNKIGNKSVIWGRPCYYWICPSLNLVLSIKFNHSMCDAQLFEDYVTYAIKNKVPNPLRKVTHNDKSISISFNLKGQSSSLYYRFKKSLIILKDTTKKLRQIAPNITHMIKRETVIVHSKDERAEWVKLFDNLPFLSARSKSKTRKIEFRVEARPSIQQLEEIIKIDMLESQNTDKLNTSNTVQSVNPSRDEWDNIGFTDGTDTVWLDKYRLKETIRIIGKKNELIYAAELADAVSKKRNKILGLIQVGDESETTASA